jgi:NAD-dependent DNA ligase
MIGKNQATHLAARYKTMKHLQLAVSSPLDPHSSSTPDDPFLQTLAGSSLRAWFANSDNKLLLNQLRQAGICCCQEDPAAADVIISNQADSESAGNGDVSGNGRSGSSSTALQGVSVCITGGIANTKFAKREEVAEWIESLGGSFKGALTKGVDWLVVSCCSAVELLLVGRGRKDWRRRRIRGKKVAAAWHAGWISWAQASRGL